MLSFIYAFLLLRVCMREKGISWLLEGKLRCPFWKSHIGDELLECSQFPLYFCTSSSNFSKGFITCSLFSFKNSKKPISPTTIGIRAFSVLTLILPYIQIFFSPSYYGRRHPPPPPCRISQRMPRRNHPSNHSQQLCSDSTHGGH